ncbi:MAG: hypothetical protein SFZ23_08600 [Planctomycetota bacterium]|nr:hypothetical protein [Planctomycetota bacterium]
MSAAWFIIVTALWFKAFLHWSFNGRLSKVTARTCVVLTAVVLVAGFLLHHWAIVLGTGIALLVFAEVFQWVARRVAVAIYPSMRYWHVSQDEQLESVRQIKKAVKPLGFSYSSSRGFYRR